MDCRILSLETSTTGVSNLNYGITHRKAFFGCKEWANAVLKIGIKECYNHKRVASARQIEIISFIQSLEECGYWWQAERLRNHYHRFLYHLQPPKVDDHKEGGISS